MEPASFKNLLEKLNEGTNSMEEVYNQLSYLTSNHDKEIEKLQKQLEDEKTRANNEEFVRHEAEKDLENMRKLQGINFSVIVGGLIEKPKKEFELQLQQSLKKFTTTIIFLTLICIGLIIASFYYFQKNNFYTNNQEIKSIEIEKFVNEIKKENEELKEYIKKSIQKPLPIKIEKPKIEVDEVKLKEVKKEEEILILNKPKEESIKPSIKEEESIIVNNDTNSSLQKIDDQDLFQERVLSLLVNYENKFKLSGKNNSRILYKMFLLDLAPFKHDSVLEEIKLFAKNYTYVPKKEEIMIWDKQMLYIYTKMLEKIKDIPESKITSNMRAFHSYKKDDATIYSGWEYLGESDLTTKESLEKEIKAIKAHIELNTK